MAPGPNCWQFRKCVVQMWARLKQAQLPNPQKEAKMTLRLQKRREEEVVVGGSSL